MSKVGFAHHASASKFNMTDPVLEGQEEGGGAAAKDPKEIVLDDAAASAVLERLVHLGFLDEHVSGGGGGGIDAASSPPSPGRWLLEEPAEYTPQSSREAMERLAEARAGRIGGPGEEGRPRCEVVIRDGGSGGCITRAALAEEMARRVRAHPFEGRANIADLAVAAGVREDDAEEVVKLLHAGDADGFSGRPAFVQAGREVLTAEPPGTDSITYLTAVAKEQSDHLRKSTDNKVWKASWTLGFTPQGNLERVLRSKVRAA